MSAKAKPTPPRKLQPFDIVIVSWEDAMACASIQVDGPRQAMQTYSPANRRTAGYFIAKDKHVVILATDDDRNLPGTGAEFSCGGLIYIPTSLVREIRFVCATQLTKAK